GALGWLEAMKVRSGRELLFFCCSPLGVPLLPLYTREAGLQERFPNRLRVGVLIGYNYNSSCTRKIGSIPTPLEASCSFCATNNPDGVRWHSVGPTHPVRASALWASSWVSWDNIPHRPPRTPLS